MATVTLTKQKEPESLGSRRVISTVMNYYNDPGNGTPPTPVIVGSTTVKNERVTVSVDITVIDITGDEDRYALDSHGFQLCRHESKEKEFRDEDSVPKEYFDECEQLLKDVTGASRVFVFDHKVRRGPTNWHSIKENNRLKKGPLRRAHIDQSYDGAEMVLRKHLPDEADQLLKKRFEIINVWRPIKTVYKDPLAVTDANSVADEDLVAAAIIYPDHRSETWTVKPNPAHRWYFKYAQQPDEVLLIKCFDTDTSVARRVPHGAFRDPEQDDNYSRESIETRCLVFHD